MNDDEKFSHLKRPRYPMPDFVRQALLARGLMDDYRARPTYQQNDYIGWIIRAKREATVQKRLAQKPDELEASDVYMKMAIVRSRESSLKFQRRCLDFQGLTVMYPGERPYPLTNRITITPLKTIATGDLLLA